MHVSRKHLFLAGTALSFLALLCGPVGTWLQGREMWIAGGERLDAVYMLAGERAQDRRVEAVAECVKKVSGVGCQGTAPFVLTGNDTAKSRWSREEQRNLAVGEWAVVKLGYRLSVIGYRVKNSETERGDEVSSGGGKGGEVQIRLVPGHISGTDDEMDVLAAYLQTNAGIQSIALVTSPFHVRRAAWRLRTHLARPLIIRVAPAAPTWRDRAPWTVLAELAKMARDAVGLSRAPLVSRGG